MQSPRQLLTAFYRAAVAAAEPEAATLAVVDSLELARDARIWVIALGKAAPAMTRGTIASLARRGHEIAGGIVVAPLPISTPGQSEDATSPKTIDPRLESRFGDHPLPGPASLQAADAIGKVVSRVRAGDVAIVLVSGGGSSLVAAPAPEAPEITPDDVTALYSTLLASGMDIQSVNSTRRRFVRWGGGRLATALTGATVHCLVVSDVPGDDPGLVSSGPCAADPLSAARLITMLKRADVWPRLPERARENLELVECGGAPETPKPNEAAFQRVTTRLVLDNHHALAGAAAAARAAGIEDVTIVSDALVGEAAISGVRLASDLIARVARARGPRISRCVIWGGETTVTALDRGRQDGSGAHAGLGGRNQELALAAARSLGDAGARAHGVTLLAAGTDGRDGPTDAAGAIVDGLTWSAIHAAGRDPATDLARHDAHTALDTAAALLRTGLTGTNVMDVVIGLVL